MITVRFRTLLLALLTLTYFSSPAGSKEAAGTPSLILFIVVDGLSYREFEAVRPRMTSGGFRWIAENGASFEDADYGHAVTQTGPGHATLLTGTHPRRHAIVGNNWIDRKKGRAVYCVSDPRYPPLKASREKSYGISPRFLLEPTLGDLLRETYGPRSKVYSVAGKDRSAVLTAGKSGIAYFPGRKIQRLLTSRYYQTDYPAWWKAYHRRKAAEKRKFGSMDARVMDLVPALIEGEKLGESDGAPDLLVIGLSELDYINHAEGPESKTSERTLLKADRLVGDLLHWLRGRPGFEDILIVVSADHGFMPRPFQGRPGSHQKASDRRLYFEDISGTLKEALGGSEKKKKRFKAAAPWFYLQNEDLKKAAEALRGVRGVQEVYTRKEADKATSGIGRMVANSWNPEHAGDLCVVPKTGWFFSTRSSHEKADHGSPHESNIHVPLMILGQGVAPGKRRGPVEIVDVVPSVAGLAGLDFKSGDGRAIDLSRGDTA